jgi:hypothetical protein
MRGAAVPKATVQEDCHARPRKGNVGTDGTTTGNDDRQVYAEAQSMPMQRRPQTKLGTCISVAIRRHDPPSNGRYVGPWIPGLDWRIGHVHVHVLAFRAA